MKAERGYTYLRKSVVINEMRYRKALKTILLIWLLLLWLASVTPGLIAQSRMTAIQAEPNNCEDALAILDYTALEARKNNESYMIVIARLGRGERSQTLSHRRLKAAMDNLSRKVNNKIVAAYGERVNAYGRLEFYVGGKLLYVLVYPKNGIIDCRDL